MNDARVAIDSARGDKLPANAPLQLGDRIVRETTRGPAVAWIVTRVWRLAPAVAESYGWPHPHAAWKATLTADPADGAGVAESLTISLNPPSLDRLADSVVITPQRSRPPTSEPLDRLSS